MAEAIERVIPVHNWFTVLPRTRASITTFVFRKTDHSAAKIFPPSKEMSAIIAEDRPFTRYELDLEAGLEKVRGEGSKYKIDNAERAIEAGSDQLMVRDRQPR